MMYVKTQYLKSQTMESARKKKTENSPLLHDDTTNVRARCNVRSRCIRAALELDYISNRRIYSCRAARVTWCVCIKWVRSKRLTWPLLHGMNASEGHVMRFLQTHLKQTHHVTIAAWREYASTSLCNPARSALFSSVQEIPMFLLILDTLAVSF